MPSLADYDYDLPPELIAQEPLPERADSRLLVVDRATSRLAHRHVRDLPQLLGAGDALVLNETQVVPARLVGRRTSTGGRWEGLFLGCDPGGLWQLICKCRGRLQPGETITIQGRDGTETVELQLEVRQPGGAWLARPRNKLAVLDLLGRVGHVPLPHYIRGGRALPSDSLRYQTVYARTPGSAAAPTAGLHFTHELLERISHQGIEVVKLTLHVGLDTFRPISTENLDSHSMHSEWGEISAQSAARLQAVRAQGGKIVAVGTTTVRVLETAAAQGALSAWSGHTNLFIRPPYTFRAVDGLLTNFHLPRSTLLVLVRTLGGNLLIRQAYEEAIAERYRFFSYGDAMLIL